MSEEQDMKIHVLYVRAHRVRAQAKQMALMPWQPEQADTRTLLNLVIRLAEMLEELADGLVVVSE